MKKIHSELQKKTETLTADSTVAENEIRNDHLGSCPRFLERCNTLTYVQVAHHACAVKCRVNAHCGASASPQLSPKVLYSGKVVLHVLSTKVAGMKQCPLMFGSKSHKRPSAFTWHLTEHYNFFRHKGVGLCRAICTHLNDY